MDNNNVSGSAAVIGRRASGGARRNWKRLSASRISVVRSRASPEQPLTGFESESPPPTPTRTPSSRSGRSLTGSTRIAGTMSSAGRARRSVRRRSNPRAGSMNGTIPITLSITSNSVSKPSRTRSRSGRVKVQTEDDIDEKDSMYTPPHTNNTVPDSGTAVLHSSSSVYETEQPSTSDDEPMPEPRSSRIIRAGEAVRVPGPVATKPRERPLSQAFSDVPVTPLPRMHQGPEKKVGIVQRFRDSVMPQPLDLRKNKTGGEAAQRRTFLQSVFGGGWWDIDVIWKPPEKGGTRAARPVGPTANGYRGEFDPSNMV